MASGAFMNRSKDPRLTAYSAVKQVGKGSYGEVFLVKHLKEKKQVGGSTCTILELNRRV